jgi:hypothetical protein
VLLWLRKNSLIFLVQVFCKGKKSAGLLSNSEMPTLVQVWLKAKSAGLPKVPDLVQVLLKAKSAWIEWF